MRIEVEGNVLIVLFSQNPRLMARVYALNDYNSGNLANATYLETNSKYRNDEVCLEINPTAKIATFAT